MCHIARFHIFLVKIINIINIDIKCNIWCVWYKSSFYRWQLWEFMNIHKQIDDGYEAPWSADISDLLSMLSMVWIPGSGWAASCTDHQHYLANIYIQIGHDDLVKNTHQKLFSVFNLSPNSHCHKIWLQRPLMAYMDTPPLDWPIYLT
jgi:hypothetical protein